VLHIYSDSATVELAELNTAAGATGCLRAAANGHGHHAGATAASERQTDVARRRRQGNEEMRVTRMHVFLCVEAEMERGHGYSLMSFSFFSFKKHG
jgi:hypothetical protein